MIGGPPIGYQYQPQMPYTPPRSKPVAARPPAKPAFSPVSVPAADALGIELTESVGLPPPDALGINLE